MPASIQSLVLARMDRLSASDKRALQAASVIGQRFALGALRHVLDDADYACTGLIEHHLARPEGDDFLFAHALIQEGVYGSLLKATKHALHLRAAEWFADHDLVLRAQHLDRADDRGAPKAYLEAAQGQASLYHYERALRLVERGRELAKGTADEFALTALHGEFLHDVGMVTECLAAYRRALELAADDIDRCKAWLGLAAGLRLSNESSDALELLEQAEPIAVQHDLTLDLARLYHLRGNLYFILGNVDACGAAHEKALKFARQAGSAEAEARSLGGMGDAAYARGRMITAHRHFSDCVQLCREQGFGRIEVAHLGMVAWTLHYANELHSALDTTLVAAESSKKVGDRRAEINAVSCALGIMIELGESGSAPRYLERLRFLVEHLGARAWEPDIGLNEAEFHEAEGRHRQALDALEQSLAIARETSVGFLVPRILGVLAATTDDPSIRDNALNEGEALLQKGSLSHGYLEFYRHAMEARLKPGDWHEVERYAAALEDFTRPEPLPWSDFFIARARVLAAYGRGKRDDATVQELKRLRDEAVRVGFIKALPALEKALEAG
jgi:tetratricopeptide (TPR) repeat protein